MFMPSLYEAFHAPFIVAFSRTEVVGAPNQGVAASVFSRSEELKSPSDSAR
jgi:hypothetical protein